MAKTVLITGASSGIGKATAKLFSQQRDWNVVATARTPAQAGFFGEGVLVLKLDVTDPKSIDEALVTTYNTFGGIDLLINNAGYGQYGLFEAISAEQAKAQFDVNVFGVMNVTRAALPFLRAKGGGGVINIGSGAGLYTLPLMSLYCASKFALEGFSEALAYELASQNIFVKLVEPHGGVTETKFMERQNADAALPDDALAAYDAYVEKVRQAFAGFAAARTISAEDVAAVIFKAATDGRDDLRYLVGNDTRGFVAAWDGLANADYVDYMRSKFK